ncbi:MAG: DUF5320 domain-containing protein [Chloroflexota bacterium]
MPGGDRTGPLGAGPRTGRGMGYCSGYDRPSFANPAPEFRGGYGFGRGGTGRGWRHRFYATGVPGWVTPTPEQETADLKAQADWLKGQLDAIQKRIEELTSK